MLYINISKPEYILLTFLPFIKTLFPPVRFNACKLTLAVNHLETDFDKGLISKDR